MIAASGVRNTLYDIRNRLRHRSRPRNESTTISFVRALAGEELAVLLCFVEDIFQPTLAEFVDKRGDLVGGKRPG